MRDLVRYAYAGGEEEDRAVGGEVFVAWRLC